MSIRGIHDSSSSGRYERWLAPWRRWSVRTRLTALFGGLFFASGVVLLGVTYILVDLTTTSETLAVVLPDGSSVAVSADVGEPDGTAQDVRSNGSGTDEPPPQPDPGELRALAVKQHDERMLALLTQSAIALVVTAVLAIVLGWIVAGRVLSPIRTIIERTRTITATGLHERLALAGPRDELGELGETIDELLARLERSFEAQRRFVQNASHELRTPLARQRTIAEVALEDPKASTRSLRQAHERVLAAGRQQADLIDSLLILAKGESGGGSVAQPVDLADVARSALAERAAQAESNELLIVTDLEPAVVTGEPALIGRLVDNLVDNAIRYNHPGGTVHVSIAVRSGHPELTVVNTGSVVPRDRVAELFDPFRRLEGARTQQDGHGLGLSIVKSVADLHSARIIVEPQPSGGLHFTVIWPSLQRPRG